MFGESISLAWAFTLFIYFHLFQLFNLNLIRYPTYILPIFSDGIYKQYQDYPHEQTTLSKYIYVYRKLWFSNPPVGWSGGAKVLCILHHRGVQLILAYSWARPAILVVGKGRGGMFLFLLFLFLFLPCPSLSSPLLSLLSLFSLSLGDDTKWPWRVDVSLNPNTINQQPAGIKTHIYFKNPFRNLSLYNRTIKLGNIVPDNWFYQAENM